MSGTFDKSKGENSVDMANAIFLQELVDGPWPSDFAGGKTSAQSGPDRAHASHSPKLENASGSPTTATFGRSGSISSVSAALQASLESRLQARMASYGPTAPEMTLKARTMPSGRRFCRLLLSGRRIDGTDFILLPTPSAQTQEGGMRIDGGARSRQRWQQLGIKPGLTTAAWLMGYPPAWLRLSPTVLATPSSRSLRPSSS